MSVLAQGRVPARRSVGEAAFILAMVSISLCRPAVLAAQAPAAITGVVEDDTGAPVPGATITLTAQSTQAISNVMSESQGTFAFAAIAPATYRLTVELSGFETYQQLVSVAAGDRKWVRVTLRVARLEQNITVEAAVDAALTSGTNTATAKLGDDLILQLPIASDDVLSVIGRFVSPMGLGAEGPSIVVDGVPGGQVDLPSSAVDSVKVNRNPYSAEFQYPGNARLEVSTKRGHRSRRLDGGLQTSLRNSALSARNAFAKSVPDLDRHLMQANLGGALGTRSAFYVAAKRFVNNESAVVNAVTLTGPVVSNVPTSERKDSVFSRLQWWPSGLHTVYLTYAYGNQPSRNEAVGGFNLPERGLDTGEQKHKITLSQSLLLPPNWSNSLLISLTKQDEIQGRAATAPAIVVNQAFTSGPSQTFTRNGRRTLDVQDSIRYYGYGGHALLFGGRFHADAVNAFLGSNFAGTFEFASLAQFAAGRPLTFRINAGDPNAAFDVYEANGFVQDEITLKRHLTLTFGMRYDWQSTVDDRNNLAPRFGFAFAPRGSQKTVVRGGAGLFYDDLPRSATERSLLFDGLRLRETVIANPSYPSPFSTGQIVSPPASTIRIAPGVQSPYGAQASIGIEREFRPQNRVSAEYLVARGVHQFRSRNVNAPLETGLRPDPAFLNINQIESTAFAQGQAMTFSWQGRIGRLFKPYVQYVLSKTTNDTSGIFALPASSIDLRPEIGPADFDQRHRLNVMGLLALPRAFQTGLVLSVGSGLPYNITTGFDDNGDTVANDRPAGVTRNTGRGPGTLQLDIRFAKNIDVRREATAQKRDSLELMLDVFNAINRTNVSSIVGTLSSPFFGRANAAAPARALQLSVRYGFRR